MTILCDGVEPGMTIALSYGKKTSDYREIYCRKDWKLCKVAKMLWDASENQTENL